ncbi:MAG: hypothetical protein AAB624_02625 [Patescibacteria group bacterium]
MGVCNSQCGVGKATVTRSASKVRKIHSVGVVGGHSTATTSKVRKIHSVGVVGGDTACTPRGIMGVIGANPIRATRRVPRYRTG